MLVFNKPRAIHITMM